MKLYIWLLIIFFVIVTGCEDFLEEENKSGITADGFYTTEVGFESLINSCYTPLRYWYGRENASNFTETGTDLVTKAAGHTNQPVNDYSSDFTAANSDLNDLWTWLYQGINFCNTALAYADDESVEIDDDIRTTRKGEASFLWAFYYWHVVEFWGDTYLSTTPTEGAVTTGTPSSISDIYDEIFAHLDVAIANCSADAEDGGRVTQYAAMAFKARMLLTRASELNDASMYASAASLAKEVINNGPFELFNDFASLWDMSNSDGSANSEVIWYVNYSTDNLLNQELDNDTQIRNGGNNLHLMYCMKYDNQPGMQRDIENGRPFNRYMPTKFLLQLFDMDHDQRWKGTFKTLWMANWNREATPTVSGYENMVWGDTAIWCMNGIATDAQRVRAANRYQIFDLNDVYHSDGSVSNRYQNIQINKFADPTRSSISEDRSSRDAFVMRIAEMYLIVAEAEMESNPTEAVSYLNILRRKRAIPGHEAAMEISEGDLELNFILDERARELVGEQLRWFDLKRTEKLVNRVQLHNMDASDNITENHIVRPYPQEFLDALSNASEWPQHTGYK